MKTLAAILAVLAVALQYPLWIGKGGWMRVWELERKRLEKARAYLDQIAAQWDAAAARLKAFVEQG